MAATTTKFNKIAQIFMDKAGDPITVSGDVIQAGKVVDSKAKIESYVNRALHKFFADTWASVKGKKEEFIKIFPELVRNVEAQTITSQEYTPSSYNDIFKLIGATIDSALCRIWEMDVYSLAEAGTMTQYKGSLTNPGLIYTGSKIKSYGKAGTFTNGLYFQYIKRPVKVADGNPFVSSANDEDTPFHEFWDETLGQIAYDLYLKDSQQMM